MRKFIAAIILTGVTVLASEAPRPVNVNTATAKELAAVKGIGPTLAQRIVEARPYERLDDLERVKGIGPKRLANVRPFLFVECDTDTDCESRNGIR